ASLLANALRVVRNLRAHGQHLHSAPFHVEDPQIQWLCAALLLALIRFLEGSQGPMSRATIAAGKPLTERLLKSAQNHLPEDAADLLKRPSDAVKLNGRAGSDSIFIAYALISAID